jgi:hypothetical protein
MQQVALRDAPDYLKTASKEFCGRCGTIYLPGVNCSLSIASTWKRRRRAAKRSRSVIDADPSSKADDGSQAHHRSKLVLDVVGGGKLTSKSDQKAVRPSNNYVV